MSKVYKEKIKKGDLLGQLVPCKIKDGSLVPQQYSTREPDENDMGAYYIPHETEIAVDVDAKIMDKDGNLLDEIRDMDKNELLYKKEDFLKQCPEIWDAVGPGGLPGNNTTKGHHIIFDIEPGQIFKKNKVYYKKIPFHFRGKAGGKGCGIFVDGSRKEGKEITHFAFADFMERDTGNIDPTMRDTLSKLSTGKIKHDGDTTAKKTTKKKKANDDDKIVDPYVRHHIPEGHRWDALWKTGCAMIDEGLSHEAREYLLHWMNEEVLCKPYPPEQVDRMLGDLQKKQEEKKRKCPFNIIHTSSDDGLPNIIVKGIKSLGYDFRRNERGNLLEGRKGDGEWMQKEEKLWRSYLRSELQNNLKYGIEILPILNDKGEYKYTKLKAGRDKIAKFPAGEIQETFDVLTDGKRYDPFWDYLFSEPVQKLVGELEREHVRDGKIVDVMKLPIFNCVEEIIQHEQNENVKKKYPKVDYEYWRWFLWMGVFGAVYCTLHPGERFAEIPVLMGEQGTFKTSLFEFLLPKELRHMCITTSFSEDDTEMKRCFDQAIYAIIDEMDDFWKNEQRNLRMMGARKWQYRPLYQTALRTALRRCGVICTTNKINPLKMSPDAQRRWVPAALHKNKKITERGKEEGKTTQGYMDYAEEWGDKWRDLCYASCLLMEKYGQQPGLPAHLDEKREEAVRMASGVDKFIDVVTKTIQSWRNEGFTAIDYVTLYEKIPFRRSPDKDDMILEIVGEMGGDSEIHTGRYVVRGRDGMTQNKNQQFIYLAGIPKMENTQQAGRDIDEPGESVEDMEYRLSKTSHQDRSFNGFD